MKKALQNEELGVRFRLCPRRAPAGFSGRNFVYYGAHVCNKTTAIRASDGGAVAIFAVLSTPLIRRLTFPFGALDGSGAKGNWVMQRVAILLRKAPSRIGQRLAQLIAIAAASLPEVGA
ncbi:MAG TPA: hypothetical protein VHB49_03690 [Bradyrhizobium sp.]|nr:hypothetical protein [Bradyrhizobium sp.]